MNEQIVIREMIKSDCELIARAFAEQGWEKPVNQYLDYFRESIENKRLILLAEFDGQFAGYVTIIWDSTYPAFSQADIPEIADLNVLRKFQRMKVGTAIMNEAEKRIALRSSVAGLGVGLYKDYGIAQVLYIKRGYVPDSYGVFYNGQYPEYGEQVQIDDDLCLFLTKQLR